MLKTTINFVMQSIQSLLYVNPWENQIEADEYTLKLIEVFFTNEKCQAIFKKIFNEVTDHLSITPVEHTDLFSDTPAYTSVRTFTGKSGSTRLLYINNLNENTTKVLLLREIIELSYLKETDFQSQKPFSGAIDQTTLDSVSKKIQDKKIRLFEDIKKELKLSPTDLPV